MKKTDIALIVIIISISAGIAYWVASMTIGQSNDKPIVVRTAEPITTDEVKVDERVFAKDSINPTVEATISGEDLTSFIDPTEEVDAQADDQGEVQQGQSIDTAPTLPDDSGVLPSGE